MTLRDTLRQLTDTEPFPDVVEPQARLLQGVKLLVPVAGRAADGVATFLVAKDAYGRSWIYAYLDEEGLVKGTGPGQQYSVFLFEDLVEIAKANGFGGITIDQHERASTALLPEDYFDQTLAILKGG